MKSLKIFLALFVILFGAVASESALARGGHHHRSRVGVGVFIGAPLFWYYPPPYYYYPPAYYPPAYYPPVVSVPSSPPVYIERGDAQPAPERAQSYWYYCPDSRAYYPYVKQCPGGWQRVAPQPPPAS